MLLDTLLIVLLGVWAVLLFGGFLLGRPHKNNKYRMPTWARMASSLTLVVAAWVWVYQAREAHSGIFALLVAIGMSLGFVGDLFMADLLRRFIPLKESALGGIGAFGLGHVAYITGMLWLENRYGLTADGPRLGAWGLWLLIGALGWYVVVFRGQQKRSILHFAALGYALLLASTAGTATGLALQQGSFLPLAFGAALFLLSDLIIAGEMFSGLRFPLIGDVIWLTYGPAQALIVYSISAALILSR